MAENWEYKEFCFPYRPGWSWYRLGMGGTTDTSARFSFWSGSQRFILPEIQKWLDEGWEPIGEIGPSAITLHYYRSLGKTGGDLVLGVFLTLCTFGLYLLIGWNEYVEPQEFRVQMRRKK